MRQQCIKAVTQALGRALTATEVRDIEGRIRKAARRLAAKDPQTWRAMSHATQLQTAAQQAAVELMAEAALKRRRESLTILAHSRIASFVTTAMARGLGGMDALERILAFHADGKSNTLSVESQGHAINRDALRQMLGTLEASHPKFFGLFENQQGVENIIHELFNEPTGDADAHAGAKQFHQVATELRERFNNAGGDVGELEDWGLPQHHSQLRVAKAGRDAWVSKTLPRVERDKYYNEDGSRMNNAQLTEFLGHAWESIATGGANKMTPGQFNGSGARANRGSASRQIHFRDAASYIEYQKEFGERTLYEVLTHHIEAAARDVALVETMGPNPEHTFRLFRDTIAQQEKLANPVNTTKIDEAALHAERLYNVVSGKTIPIASEWLAKSFDTLRNWLIAARLGSSVITSFSDDATLHLTGQLNHLPEMRLLANELAAMNPANRTEERMAQRAGLAMQTLVASLNRFGQDGLGASFSRKLASTTLRASGLNAWTEARRRGFGVTMMGTYGSVAHAHPDLASVDPHDYRIMLSKGITENEFQVWKAARLENWGGGNDTMLTPEAIYAVPDSVLQRIDKTVPPQQLRQQAATRLLGAVLEETDVAVVEPGARDRAVTMSDMTRGTWKGELTRSFFLFKSFPLAMISRHWQRGMGMPNAGGRAAYLATLLAATTVAGMASLQVSELLSGRDPRNMNVTAKGGVRNWIAAAMKGGSLGLYGDFLFSDSTQYGNTPLGAITGPVLGEAEDFVNLTQGNIMRLSHGQKSHAGAEAVRMFKGNLPGASLWYAKGALDHMVFHQLQEYFSPGYLSTMRTRAARDFGQRYWWEPGQVAPSRGPDLEAAVGQ